MATTDDAKVELDETLTVILLELAVAAAERDVQRGGAPLTGTGTITNDDVGQLITIGRA